MLSVGTAGVRRMQSVGPERVGSAWCPRGCGSAGRAVIGCLGRRSRPARRGTIGRDVTAVGASRMRSVRVVRERCSSWVVLVGAGRDARRRRRGSCGRRGSSASGRRRGRGRAGRRVRGGAFGGWRPRGADTSQHVSVVADALRASAYASAKRGSYALRVRAYASVFGIECIGSGGFEASAGRSQRVASRVRMIDPAWRSVRWNAENPDVPEAWIARTEDGTRLLTLRRREDEEHRRCISGSSRPPGRCTRGRGGPPGRERPPMGWNDCGCSSRPSPRRSSRRRRLGRWDGSTTRQEEGTTPPRAAPSSARPCLRCGRGPTTRREGGTTAPWAGLRYGCLGAEAGRDEVAGEGAVWG